MQYNCCPRIADVSIDGYGLPEVMEELMLARKYDCAQSIYRAVRGDALADSVEDIKFAAFNDSAWIDVLLMSNALKVKNVLVAAQCDRVDDAVLALFESTYPRARRHVYHLNALYAKVKQVDEGRAELATMHDSYLHVSKGDGGYEDFLRQEMSMWDALYPKIVELAQHDVGRKDSVQREISFGRTIANNMLKPEQCSRPPDSLVQHCIARTDDICAQRRECAWVPMQHCSERQI